MVVVVTMMLEVGLDQVRASDLLEGVGLGFGRDSLPTADEIVSSRFRVSIWNLIHHVQSHHQQ